LILHGDVALDVYEEEKGIFFEDLSLEILHDDELARPLTFPNVLLTTAHQAFFTREALSEIARVTVENVRRFASEKTLLEWAVL
jgi:D-lactate dehydrogenase